MQEASGQFEVYDGLTKVTSQCSFSKTDPTGISSSIGTDGAYSLASMSDGTDSGKVTFNATYNGVSIDKEFSVSKSKAGKDAYASTTDVSSIGVSELPDNSVIDFIEDITIFVTKGDQNISSQFTITD